ncbi:MAG: hypothetical protein PPP56_02770 [Longimonas sp.]|uniref:hypothetical protein n=1 Tax=Longimonas sp. TaxID=2039626 RepID=UPI00334C6BAD
MYRIATRTLGVVLLLVWSLALVGCDDDISSVEDLDIQPSIDLPSSLSLALLDAESRTEFSTTYQGLDQAPDVSGSGNLVVERISESGSAEQGGSQQWSVGYDGTVSGVQEETITIQTSSEGESIEREINVTVSPFVISTDFASRFIVVEDFETDFPDNQGADNPADQRPITTTGATTAAIQSEASSPNSNGPNALEINAAAGDPVSFESTVSAPGANLFTFLVRSPDAAFDLTLTFVEEANGAEVEHEIVVPITEGAGWRQYGIGFSQIDVDFNPVAVRAGGNGPLKSVRLSADADVTFQVDELMLGTEQGSIAEINDFEATTNAYITFSGASFGFTDQVAENAFGTRARDLQDVSFFGYNQGGIRIQDAANGELKFRIGAVAEDTELEVFLELNEGGGTATNITIEAGSEWQDISVPISELAENPSALASGISNVGFNFVSGSSSFLIDDLRLDATGN